MAIEYDDLMFNSFPTWMDALPDWAEPYARLARLDRPAGFMLLLYPAWWAQILATPPGELPSVILFVLFYIGAVVMRAAGCAVNDVWDRKLDAQVERTRDRPVASGEIKVWQALVFAACCTLIGLCIVLYMGKLCLWLALSSLPLIAIYPLMKRITWWPQIMLGIVFNWGALMGYAAVQHTVPMEAILLYAACFFWTLSYDTIYAFQDIRDDEQAGIKSTARRLGARAKPVIALWQALSMLLLLIVGAISEMSIVFYIGVLVAAIYMARLWLRWNPKDEASSRDAFKAHTLYADILVGAMLIGRVMP